MEYITVLLPFLGAGFMSAVISRFTGVAISMLLVPTILYMGATPAETIAFMLTFVLYNNFTVETQDVRMSAKDLVFFPGWRLIIPVILSLVIGLVLPYVGVGIFIFCFILELAAALYYQIPVEQRPTVASVVYYSLAAMVACIAGVLLFPFIPAPYFFIVVGVAILTVTAFAWYAGKHRDAFRGSWGTIWTALAFVLGFVGIEASSYNKGLRRSFATGFDGVLSIVMAMGAFAGMMLYFAMYNEFSMPSLIAAIGSAIGIRFFGVYEFSRGGSFSYVAIALAMLAVLCLYLVAPEPVGFTAVQQVFDQQVVTPR